jgi:ATP-dependent helicase HepA
LFEKIPNIIKLADDMRTTVKKEQNFDAAGFIYRPMYNELKRLIDYYAQNENELFALATTIKQQYPTLALISGHYTGEGAKKVFNEAFDQNYINFHTGFRLIFE